MPHSVNEFGGRALHGDGLNMTSEERLVHSLVGDIPQEHSLTIRQANGITTARIRYALAELANMNLDNAHRWLNEVAKDSPKAALELLMALLEFNVPKVKAIAVDVRSGDGSIKTLSMKELEERVAAETGAS